MLGATCPSFAAARPSCSSARPAASASRFCVLVLSAVSVLAALCEAADEDATGTSAQRDGASGSPPSSPAEYDGLIFLGPNVDPDGGGDRFEQPAAPRIIGGRPSPVLSQPYMASLKGERWGGGVMVDDDVHYCAATVIAPNVLLSAAHCARSWQWAEVGRYDLSDRGELSPGGSSRGVRAAKIYKDYERKHPGYKPRGAVTGNGHDLMLIKLKKNVPDHIEPVMLDLRLFDSHPRLAKGDPLLVSGWGVKDAQRNPSSILLDATVFSVPNGECARSSGQGASYAGAIDATMMCAKAEGKDSCQGDSGGPLILQPDDGNWGGYNDGRDSVHVQAGIVSFGIGCANRNFPGVYSRVSAQAEWIRENVCDMTAGDAPRWFNCNGELDDDESDTTVPVGGDNTEAEKKPPTPVPTLRPTPAPVSKKNGRRRRRRDRKKYNTRANSEGTVAIAASRANVRADTEIDPSWEEAGNANDPDPEGEYPFRIAGGVDEKKAAKDARVRLVADDTRHPRNGVTARAGDENKEDNDNDTPNRHLRLVGRPLT